MISIQLKQSNVPVSNFWDRRAEEIKIVVVELDTKMRRKMLGSRQHIEPVGDSW